MGESIESESEGAPVPQSPGSTPDLANKHGAPVSRKPKPKKLRAKRSKPIEERGEGLATWFLKSGAETLGSNLARIVLLSLLVFLVLESDLLRWFVDQTGAKVKWTMDGPEFEFEREKETRRRVLLMPLTEGVHLIPGTNLQVKIDLSEPAKDQFKSLEVSAGDAGVILFSAGGVSSKSFDWRQPHVDEALNCAIEAEGYITVIADGINKPEGDLFVLILKVSENSPKGQKCPL